MKAREKEPCYGDIFMAVLDGKDHEPQGYLPVLIISNNFSNISDGNVAVAVVTENREPDKKYALNVPCFTGRDSIVHCNQIRTISKSRLRSYIMTLDGGTMRKVSRALMFYLNMVAPNSAQYI